MPFAPSSVPGLIFLNRIETKEEGEGESFVRLRKRRQWMANLARVNSALGRLETIALRLEPLLSGWGKGQRVVRLKFVAEFDREICLVPYLMDTSDGIPF
ncbi:unnamed protein product [Durusdinium trenchii]|uniref:Uncharacterized protein n=1 Tax=Durusdinium trenchii TaxID=1381693 RepID=A0ABP0M065_9DINO